VANGYKFLAVKRLKQEKLLNCSKTQFLPTPPAFGTSVGVIPSEFHRVVLNGDTDPPE